MSPEQALGEEVDHRTDIFALGIILYETTTGTRLFKQKNELATLQAIMKCEFVLPSEALHNYPPRLEQILLKALAKDRKDRFEDADDFSAALYDFLYESGLYVEREEIADFMKDLFAEQPQEKKGTGGPAVLSTDEAREDLAEIGTAKDANNLPRFEVPLHPEVATRAYGGGPAKRATSKSAGHQTVDEDDLGFRTDPQIQERDSDIENTVDQFAQRRKSTYVVRRTERIARAERAERGAPEPRMGSDQAPTVAIPSYVSDPLAQLGIAAYGSHPEVLDTTDRKPKRIEGFSNRSSRPRASSDHIRRPAWVAGAVGLTLLVMILTGILFFRTAETRIAVAEEPLEMPPRIAPARLTIHTEPGSDIYAQGDLLGTADSTGQAGPYPIAPGEVLIRVQHAGLGFERQRLLPIDPGQNYQFEILGRPGFLRVAVAPWARVRVDGRDMGLTPLPRLSLLEGVHEVELINPDIRRRYQGIIRIMPGEESELKVDLQESGEGL